MRAQTSQPSATNASECDGLARACSGAARELKAARELIKGYEQHIEAAGERIVIARKEIETLKGIGALHVERAKELQNVIDAERTQIKILLEQKDLMEARIKQLDRQARRARQFALITTVAAAVGILIAVGK